MAKYIYNLKYSFLKWINKGVNNSKYTSSETML